MRQARTFARASAGLITLFLGLGCASAERAGSAAPGGLPAAEAVARRDITRRIDRTVDATRRLDIDALANGGGARRRADGSLMSLAEARGAVAEQLAGVDRTISLVVRIDSLRMVSDSAALVYTMQRWERILRASDGTRHRALTQNWLEQKWTLGADGWRGTGEVRETRPGTSTLDGAPYVVVQGAPID